MGSLVKQAVNERATNFYLGLDISTSSTGYAVLTPSCTERSPSASPRPASGSAGHYLRTAGQARMVEWGIIAGNGNDSDKKDVVEVGQIIEASIVDMEARCRRQPGEQCWQFRRGGRKCQQ